MGGQLKPWTAYRLRINWLLYSVVIKDNSTLLSEITFELSHPSSLQDFGTMTMSNFIVEGRSRNASNGIRGKEILPSNFIPVKQIIWLRKVITRLPFMIINGMFWQMFDALQRYLKLTRGVFFYVRKKIEFGNFFPQCV